MVLRGPGFGVWLAITRLLVTAFTPIIQYAWTFFYLRLVEVETPLPFDEPGPLYAAATPPAAATPEPALATPESPPSSAAPAPQAEPPTNGAPVAHGPSTSESHG